MPLVDLTDSVTFDRYYDKGTNIWLIVHPTTGERAVWIQGVIPQQFPTKAHLRKEVRVHYVRAKELMRAQSRARSFTKAVGLTAADRVAIIGAGFGWLQEALEEQLPGIECVCVETSLYIQGVKGDTEFVELDAAILKAGILVIEDGYTDAMNHLSRGVKSRVALNNEDINSASARNRLEGKLTGSGTKFTWAVSEHVLEWLEDGEARDLDASMHKMAPNVCHLLREYSPKQAKHTEPGYLSNWKWLSSTNNGVKQEILDLPWYTVDSWQALLDADSVLLGV